MVIVCIVISLLCTDNKLHIFKMNLLVLITNIIVYKYIFELNITDSNIKNKTVLSKEVVSHFETCAKLEPTHIIRYTKVITINQYVIILNL